VSATNVANRFGIGHLKGQIAEGFDADITLIDLHASSKISAEQLFYRHAVSPYIGAELHAVIKGTWVRGNAVYRDQRFPGQARGRLLTPKQ
jgi:allantoinase